MSLTRLTFTYAGGPQVFSTNFALGVLETEHIFVSVDGNVDGQGNQVFSNFTYDENTGNITITDILTVGDTGVIARNVPINDLITDFEQGADVTRRNLDRMAKQILMSAQQIKDQSDQDNDRVDGIIDDVLTATEQAEILRDEAEGFAADALVHRTAAGISAGQASSSASAAASDASDANTFSVASEFFYEKARDEYIGANAASQTASIERQMAVAARNEAQGFAEDAQSVVIPPLGAVRSHAFLCLTNPEMSIIPGNVYEAADLAFAGFRTSDNGAWGDGRTILTASFTTPSLEGSWLALGVGGLATFSSFTGAQYWGGATLFVRVS